MAEVMTAGAIGRRIAFLGRQLAAVGDRVLAGTATPEDERHAARLQVTLDELRAELAEAREAESLPKTVVMRREELVRYFIETGRDDAKYRDDPDAVEVAERQGHVELPQEV